MNQQDRKRLIEIAAALANGAPLDKLYSVEHHASCIGRKTVKLTDMTDAVNTSSDRLQALAVELRAIADRAQQEQSK